MRTSTGSRVFVVSVRIVVRTSVRLARRCRPWVARASEVVLELCATERGSTTTALTRYTRYAVIGGVTASAFALARAFAGPGASEALAVVGVVAMGALVVWIAIRLVHEHTSGPALPARARALIVATTQHIADAHGDVALTRTLQLVCEPQSLLTTARDPAVLARLVQHSLKKLALKHATRAVPGLSVAKDAVGVVVTGLSHARLIHDFETSARQLCAARAA